MFAFFLSTHLLLQLWQLWGSRNPIALWVSLVSIQTNPPLSLAPMCSFGMSSSHLPSCYFNFIGPPRPSVSSFRVEAKYLPFAGKTLLWRVPMHLIINSWVSWDPFYGLEIIIGQECLQDGVYAYKMEALKFIMSKRVSAKCVKYYF